MNNFYRELKPTLVIVTAICLVTIFLQFYYSGSLNLEDITRSIIFNIYFGVPLCLVNGYFFNSLNKLFPWEELPRERAVYGIIGSIVLTMFTLIVLNLLMYVLYYGHGLETLWSNSNKGFYMSALVITMIVTITIHAISFFKEIQKERSINSRLREEKLATELNALRSHVDPHFLFNSFNVLSGLIDEDKEKAQDFLAGLSKIYRYILEKRNEETSSLEEEISFTDKYLELQKMRFENSIEVKSSISAEGLSKRIPSLTLQLLLENSIKHNGFSESEPLKIWMEEKDDCLIVSNNVKPRKNLAESSRMGLDNIRERYRLLAQKEIEVQSTKELFSVKIPLI